MGEREWGIGSRYDWLVGGAISGNPLRVQTSHTTIACHIGDDHGINPRIRLQPAVKSDHDSGHTLGVQATVVRAAGGFAQVGRHVNRVVRCGGGIPRLALASNTTAWVLRSAASCRWRGSGGMGIAHPSERSEETFSTM